MEEDNTQKPIVYANANAHLDTVWNWTLEDTVKTYLVNTLKENFHLFENYPNYKFNFEGAYRYDLIKEYYPEDYEKLKEYIEEGKWFVTGSAWENGDVIVSSPEALIRNILYGNRFFKEEFNKMSNDIFLPDCFGFAYTLPAIMKHMGLKAFSSAKLTWDTGNKVPFEVGIWKGVDGSEVVAAVSPGAYTTTVQELWSRSEGLYENTKNLPVSKTFKYYGVGDVGGAPYEDSVKNIVGSVEDKDGKVTVISAYAGQLADELTSEEYSALPVFDGELLMTKHGVGSYTSVAPTKRFNRKNELAADFAERVNVFAAWLEVKDYPKDRMDEAWKTVIRHQFHDDITGTSLQRVYKESFNDYITALNQFVHELATAQENIADCVDTSGLSTIGAIPVVVFNGIDADRKDLVTADIKYTGRIPEHIKVYDYEGKEAPSQILEKGKDILKIAFTADVLSNGYNTYNVVPADEACSIDTGLSISLKDSKGVSGAGAEMESGRYRVVINELGDISSIFDKNNEKELLAEPIRYEILANSFAHYGAWEILYDDVQKAPKAIVSGNPEFKIIENGPARVSLEIKRVNAISEYRQTVTLTAVSDYVNVDNNINWLEQSALLKVAFPLAVSNQKATYDMGLGTIDRGNNEETRYEVPVHRWANLKDSSGDYSVTIMNDCKYGMDKPCENIMRLTAIHTPQNKFLDGTRQDLQDFGDNRFAYGIMGHQGGWKESDSAIVAAGYNQHLTAVQTNIHKGILPNEYSFVSLSNKGAAVKAVKPAEDTDEIIVRVAETFGESLKNIRLQVAGGIESAREVNGFEDHICDVKTEEGILIFDIEPYKLKTFALKLAKCTVGLSRKNYHTISLDGADKDKILISSANADRGSYGLTDENITIPAEIFKDELTVGGVPFKTDINNSGMYEGLISKGQKIELPENTTKLYIMGASLNDDRSAVFNVNGKETVIGIQSFDSYVGGWDQYGSNNYGYIKDDVIAFSASHTHDKSGDKVYGNFCLFKYELDITAGAENRAYIELPKDGNILVAAMTALIGNTAGSKLITRIIDKKCRKDNHTLTVTNGTGGGEYVEGNPVSIIYTGGKAGDITWEGSDGRLYSGMSFNMTMPDYDLTLTPRLKEYGENLAEGGTAVSSGEFDQNIAVNAISSEPDKYWGNLSAGSSWIILDLGSMKVFDTILIKHAGFRGESVTLNTCKYVLQIFNDDRWTDVCGIDDNRLAVTVHSFEGVCSRYIRLFVEVPTMSEVDKIVRIYGIEVYNNRHSNLKNKIIMEGDMTPFDIIDKSGDGEIIYKGRVDINIPIDLSGKMLINKWSVSNMTDCRLFVSSDINEFKMADRAFKKKFDNIQRIIPGEEALHVKIEGSLIDENKECELTLIGKSLSMVLNNKWKTNKASTRNGHAAGNEDGSIFLPKDKEWALIPGNTDTRHDLFGFNAELKPGSIMLYLCMKISDSELAGAADDLKLFKFNPVLPSGEEWSDDITVADYKSAHENEEGYKILKAEFIMTANGQIEGRISSYESLDVTISEFGIYESR